MKELLRYAFIFIIAILPLSCKEESTMVQENKLLSITDIPAEKWRELSQKKILFGHQSVGNNIIEGINTVQISNPQIILNIIETRSPGDFEKGIFAHTRIGKNLDPTSKINDFFSIMNSGVGNRIDIAFYKFCYVDIHADANLSEIFQIYKRTMDSLKKAYPDTKFVHFTVPLLRKEKTTPISWLKDGIKTLLGRNTGATHNIARNKFNDMIINEYGGKELIFDLALIESTHKDGMRETFTRSGSEYVSLAPKYTYDGGHLNELGSRIVAEQLLIFLATIR